LPAQFIRLHIMSTIKNVLSSTVSNAITAATRKDVGARKAAQVAYDLAIKEGHHWTQWIAVGKEHDGHQSTATDELRASLQLARLKGMGAAIVKLANTPTKALSEARKVEKREAAKLLARYMCADRDAMRLRQDAAYRDSKSKKAPQQPKGESTEAARADESFRAESKIIELLNQTAKKAQAMESPDFDVVALIALLAKAQQIVINH
jgi:hypothetical protein